MFKFELPPSIPQYDEDRQVTSRDLRALIEQVTSRNLRPLIEWVTRNNRRLEDWTAADFVPKGHGGILKATDTNYGTVGDGDWTTIDSWDGGMVLDPVGVIQDYANSGLRINEVGTYRFSGNFAISFSDVNRGRVFGVRLFDATSATPGRTVEYFVGRNQEGVNVAQAALLVDIPADSIGDLLQIQIAGVGDTFADLSVIDALYSVARVG